MFVVDGLMRSKIISGLALTSLDLRFRESVQSPILGSLKQKI